MPCFPLSSHFFHHFQSCIAEDRGTKRRDIGNGAASEGGEWAQPLPYDREEEGNEGTGACAVPSRGQSKGVQTAAKGERSLKGEGDGEHW